MKKKLNQFLEYIIYDLLADIDNISHRTMFGGYGIYKDGIIFAIIVENKLYFKVDKSNQADYETYGSHPFEYLRAKNKKIAMSYWELPADIIEKDKELSHWVDKSVKISLRK